MYIDQDYLETLGIELIAGQNFRSIFASRSYDGVILNDSACAGDGYRKKDRSEGAFELGGRLYNNRYDCPVSLRISIFGRSITKSNRWRYA